MNKVKHLPLFVRSCTGKKITEQYLDKIAQERINSPVSYPEPVNAILYIKHCAKDLKNKILQNGTFEHLNIPISNISSVKQPKTKPRKENLYALPNNATFTAERLDWHTCVSVFEEKLTTESNIHLDEHF